MNAFRPHGSLEVSLDTAGGRLPVGRLAQKAGSIYFAFTPSFSERLNPSPFMLRPEPGSSLIPGPRLFEGLHGVFADSLPDGWGRLLMDRKLRGQGVDPAAVTPLDRLAWIGRGGMGALTYEPDASSPIGTGTIDLDALRRASEEVLDDVPEKVLDALLAAGGSPGGARPKALVGWGGPGNDILVHGRDELPPGFGAWIVKFGSRDDPQDCGAIEYAYSQMARQAGVDMPEARLFPSKKGPGYFALRRFDRSDGGGRLHTHTLAGLLHADFRLPSLDYDAFLKATLLLTNSALDVERAFVRMVFNVLAHNRDDHPKNHSFLMDGEGRWSLSPAYDVVFSSGPGGEHSMAVDGTGKNPTLQNMLNVAARFDISRARAKAFVERVADAVSQWEALARELGVSKKSAGMVQKRLNALLTQVKMV